jgi:hypothetical protein
MIAMILMTFVKWWPGDMVPAQMAPWTTGLVPIMEGFEEEWKD